MSAGLGVYAAIPGGGSLESSDISRMRRALVAGFIVVVVYDEGKRGTVIMVAVFCCHCRCCWLRIRHYYVRPFAPVLCDVFLVSRV